MVMRVRSCIGVFYIEIEKKKNYRKNCKLVFIEVHFSF